MLISSHLPDHAFTLGAQVALLARGRLLGPGEPEALLRPDLLSELYGTPVQMLRLPEGAAGGRMLCVPMLADDPDQR